MRIQAAALLGLFACLSITGLGAPRIAQAKDYGPLWAEGQMRLAVRQLSPENRLVLLGFVPDQLLKEKAIQPSKYGFTPYGPTAGDGLMTPKYMFVTNRRGIQRVHSFDLHDSAFQIAFIEAGGALAPPVLLDVQTNRLRSLFHKVDGLALRIVKDIISFPIKAPLYPFRQLVKIREFTRSAQAAGLNYLVYQAITNCRFPSWIQAEGKCREQVGETQGLFTHEEINDMGIAIRFRYHLDLQQQLASDLLGLTGLRAEGMTYEETLFRMQAQSMRMQSLLASTFNECGLYYQRMSDTFGLISYDRNNLPDPKCLERTDMKPPAEREKEYQSKLDPVARALTGSHVVTGMCTFSHGYPLICLVDFNDPNVHRNKALILQVFRSVVSAASVLVAPAAKVIGFGQDAVEYFIVKSGSTVHKREDRRQACEELKVALAAGVKEFESLENLDREAAMYEVRNIHQFTPEQVKEFQERLSSKTPSTVAMAARELLSEFANYACGVRGISGGPGETNQVTKAREARWNSLGNLLVTGVDKLDRSLTLLAEETEEKERRKAAEAVVKKARKEEERKRKEAEEAAKPKKPAKPDKSEKPKPSGPFVNVSEGQKPVVLFMVDGLRPDSVREADRRGLIPNIRKYFLTQGHELESFTSHSVTLTSWGTILTGVEPDLHGLRATSNASRDPTVALDSYLDARHDLKYFYYGANPESRGLMRIHNAGQKWLPDYLKPEEVLTSFQPIHGQQFLPLVGFGKRARIAGLLAVEGSLSGSKELDKATSFDMASAISCNEAGGAACAVGFDLPPIKEAQENAADARYREAALTRPRSSYRLVTVWFSGIDHVGHEAPSEYDAALIAVDQGIGEIMEAASKHSVLKDAVAILTSDHGFSGGPVLENGVPGAPHVEEKFKLRPTDELFNTTFNLGHFMTGDHVGFETFPFVVGSHKIDKPFISGKYDILYNILPPFSFTYPGRQQRQALDTLNVQGRSVLVEPYGDAMAHVLFTLDKKLNTDPLRRRSYYELSNYPTPTGALDIPTSLLSVQENNIVVTEMGERAGIGPRLTGIHQNRPVGIFAMALTHPDALSWAQSIDKTGIQPGTYRAPVLVRTREKNQYKSALILTRDYEGETYFRYLILDFFDELSPVHIPGPARFKGKVTDLASADPLGYSVNLPGDWKSDREWLALLHREWFPTAIYSISRNLTLRSTYATDADGTPIVYNGPQIIDEGKSFFEHVETFLRLRELRPKIETVHKPMRDITEAEQPDFIVYANTGFSFNPFQAHSGDHGGLSREHVRNSLFVYDPSTLKSGGATTPTEPVMSRDVTATVLDYLGVQGAKIQGKSFRPLLTR